MARNLTVRRGDDLELQLTVVVPSAKFEALKQVLAEMAYWLMVVSLLLHQLLQLLS